MSDGTGATLDAVSGWDSATRELNLIGKQAEEALDEGDRFLDSAAMARVVKVRVVHRRGMGVLRGPPEGGTGATIIELKEG